MFATQPPAIVTWDDKPPKKPLRCFILRLPWNFHLRQGCPKWIEIEEGRQQPWQVSWVALLGVKIFSFCPSEAQDLKILLRSLSQSSFWPIPLGGLENPPTGMGVQPLTFNLPGWAEGATGASWFQHPQCGLQCVSRWGGSNVSWMWSPTDPLSKCLKGLIIPPWMSFFHVDVLGWGETFRVLLIFSRVPMWFESRCRIHQSQWGAEGVLLGFDFSLLCLPLPSFWCFSKWFFKVQRWITTLG